MNEASRNIHRIKNVSSSDLSVIIPAAGMSTRLRMKSSKCLAEIKQGKSLIELNIENVRRCYPNADIVVVAGYEIERFRKILKPLKVRIVYNQNYESSNVAYSMAMGLDAINTTSLLVIHGDLFYNVESIEHIDINNISKVLLDNGNLNTFEVGIGTDERKRVCHFGYSLPKKWGQIAFLAKKELEMYRDFVYNNDVSKWFSYQVLNKVIELGGKLEIFRSEKSKVYDIDTLDELYKVINNDN